MTGTELACDQRERMRHGPRRLLTVCAAGVITLLALSNLTSTRRALPVSRRSSFDLRETLRSDLNIDELQSQAAARAPSLERSAPPSPAVAAPLGPACCALRSPVVLNVTLERPVPMQRPIRIFMQTGHADGTWPCDVPCEYTTALPSSGDVDVIVGEAGAPNVPSKVPHGHACRRRRGCALHGQSRHLLLHARTHARTYTHMLPTSRA